MPANTYENAELSTDTGRKYIFLYGGNLSTPADSLLRTIQEIVMGGYPKGSILPSLFHRGMRVVAGSYALDLAFTGR